MKSTTLILALLFGLPALAADQPRTLIPCKVLSVHDGDSFHVSFDVPFIDGLQVVDRMVRLQGADAWEVKGGRPGVDVSDAEKAKGIVARNAVEELFKSADCIYLEPRRATDKIDEPHGRLSARVWVWRKDGTLLELSPWLVKNGHVRK